MRQEVLVSEPGSGPFLVVGTYLPLARYRYLPAFIGLSGRIQQQLRKTPGVVRFGVMIHFVSRHAWTCSVWRQGSEASIDDFVHSGAHAESLAKIGVWSTGHQGFARWKSPEPKVDWAELLQRLPPH